ncbi:uncharacterized protein [Palaemon carinicauda]|uniref:uncharacterized protein n=1 Tax=Palaemon carinicauda TaxID=392227 RepID=UPI0035B67609
MQPNICPRFTLKQTSFHFVGISVKNKMNWIFLLSSVMLTVNGVSVSEENKQECQVYGNTLMCDFQNSTQNVRLEESVRKFEVVFVMNAKQLFLRNSLCTTLNLYNIASVRYETTTEILEHCENNALHLHNVTIDFIPPNLHFLSMDDSHLLGSFLKNSSFKRIKAVGSSMQTLSLDTPVSGDGDIRLYQTRISAIGKLEMEGSAQFFLTDSVIESIGDASIILHENSTAEFTRTVFLQKRETNIFHYGSAKILMANVTGRVRVIYKTKSTENEDSKDVCSGQGENASSSYVTALAVFLIFSIILDIYIIVKIKSGT